MRMEVVTHDRMISLGVLAKNLFAKHVLAMDEDGKSFDILQTVKEDTLDKIKSMPLDGGFDQRIKDGAIDAFSRMKVGDKFLCLDAWVTDYTSEEAKAYWEMQRLCNEGYTLQESAKMAKEWSIKEQEKNRSKNNDTKRI